MLITGKDTNKHTALLQLSIAFVKIQFVQLISATATTESQDSYILLFSLLVF